MKDFFRNKPDTYFCFKKNPAKSLAILHFYFKNLDLDWSWLVPGSGSNVVPDPDTHYFCQFFIWNRKSANLQGKRQCFLSRPELVRLNIFFNLRKCILDYEMPCNSLETPKDQWELFKQIAYPQNVTFAEGPQILAHKCEFAIFETYSRTAHVMDSKIRSVLPIHEDIAYLLCFT
jgi:hypothetical protein